MPRPRIDIVNDPVALAVQMAQAQMEAVVKGLQTQRQPSPARQVLPAWARMSALSRILEAGSGEPEDAL